MIHYFRRSLNFTVFSTSCNLYIHLIGIWQITPGVCHVVLTFFFWPSYWVSTQWLSSSKWLARGGRRFRCAFLCIALTVLAKNSDIVADWWRGHLPKSPGMSEGLVNSSISVTVKGVPRVCQGEISGPLILGKPTISFEYNTPFSRSKQELTG